MKISIGYKKIEGPWGGGLNFSRQLTKFLEEKNFQVITDLNDDDIDIILLTEPRRYTRSSSFTHLDIKDYLNNVKNDSLVINRINECDERKKTKGLNKFLINTSEISDHTVFISSWLANLFISQGFNKSTFSTIRNGADSDYFFNKENNVFPKKFKIVTHHWGGNKNKGFDIYKKLDDLLNEDYINEKFEFIYIGNLPNNFKFNNTKVIDPMNQIEIGKFLRNCDIYITGSKNEPAGMHHIEGAMSGLPILYVDSGGITEYCKDYGMSYNLDSLESSLFKMADQYKSFKEKIVKYEFTGLNMSNSYLKLFESLIDNKEQIIKRRSKLKKRQLNQYRLGSKYFYF